MSPKWTPGPLDRVTYNGERLDEVVVSGVQSVHLEAMGWHDYYLSITVPGGRSLTLYLKDPVVYDTGLPDIDHVFGDDLLLCPAEWEGRDGRRHRCRVDEDGHARQERHRCECGAKTR